MASPRTPIERLITRTAYDIHGVCHIAYDSDCFDPPRWRVSLTWAPMGRADGKGTTLREALLAAWREKRRIRYPELAAAASDDEAFLATMADAAPEEKAAPRLQCYVDEIENLTLQLHEALKTIKHLEQEKAELASKIDANLHL